MATQDAQPQQPQQQVSGQHDAQEEDQHDVTGGRSQENQETPVEDAATTTSPRILAAWEARCNDLPAEQKQRFLENATNGLEDYLNKLETACQEHRDGKYVNRANDWLSPFFKFLEAVMPTAKTVSSASMAVHPNPSPLVLGAIGVVLELSKKLSDYQKMVLQMLSKMGRKASMLQRYEKEVYPSDESVQLVLVEVYGDILVFCNKAVRLIDKSAAEPKLKAKIRHVGRLFFHDFESLVGKEVEAFETALDKARDMLDIARDARLSQMMTNLKSQSAGVSTILEQSSMTIKQITEIQEQMQATTIAKAKEEDDRRRLKLHRKCIDWLSPLSSQAILEERQRTLIEGTGSWLKHSQQYKKWKASTVSDVLWVTGKPGSGKSMLAAVAVTDLQLEIDEETSTAYVLCSRDEPKTQTLLNVLGAVARQIVRQSGVVNKLLEEDYNNRDGSTPRISTIQSVMKNVATKSTDSHLKDIFVVIDGLDECKDREEILQELLQLVDNDLDIPIKVLIFSRPDLTIDSMLQPLHEPLRPDHGDNNTGDIKAYVQYLLPEDSQDELRKTCVEMAQGMFLWIKLVYQSLKVPLLGKIGLPKVKLLPQGLEKLYGIIFDSIWNQEEEYRSMALMVLLWLNNSMEPMKAREVLIAVSDYEDEEELKHIYNTPADALVQICMNLVWIDDHGYLRLIHDSVRKHLETGTVTPAITAYKDLEHNAHQRLGEACIQYLGTLDFSSVSVWTTHELEYLHLEHPFAFYSALWWGSHAAKDKSGSLSANILSLLQSAAVLDLTLSIDDYVERNCEEVIQHQRKFSPLHVVCHFELTVVADQLDDAAKTHMEPDGFTWTPLDYALRSKSHDTVEWILKHQPDLNVHDLAEALFVATNEAWQDIISMLATKNPALMDKRCGERLKTPLLAACDRHDQKTAMALIELGASVNIRDKGKATALISAASSGLTDTVKLLLEKGAVVNVHTHQGVSALAVALHYNHVEVLTVLAQHAADPFAGIKKDPVVLLHRAASRDAGAALMAFAKLYPDIDIDAVDEDGHTTLHTAVLDDARHAVETLLLLTRNKDATNKHGLTPLHMAVANRRADLVTILLRANCDISIPDDHGRTVLHAAAYAGEVKIMHNLLESRPQDVWQSMASMCDKDGETPLHSALRRASQQVVQLLLQLGSDVSKRDDYEGTPLHYAAHYGRSGMCRTLLAGLEDANPRDQAQWTPLHLAARRNNLAFIQELTQACQEMNLELDYTALDRNSYTPFMVAIGTGIEATAAYLSLFTPTDAYAIRSTQGDTALHWACGEGMFELVKKIAPHCDMAQTGLLGRTPLLCACSGGFTDIVSYLAQHAPQTIDECTEDKAYPLLVAIDDEHFDIANQLLDMGASVHVSNADGETALHLAADIGNIALVTRLLDSGCDKYAKNAQQETAFHAAVKGGHLAVIQLLLQRGLDSSQECNNDGHYCDSLAAATGNIEILTLLRDLGTPFGKKSKYGWTAAHDAAANGQTEALELLASYGVDLSAANEEGVTPLMSAACEGYIDAVKLLTRLAPDTVNLCTYPNGQSAMLQATRRNLLRTADALYDAGANPGLRNCLGIHCNNVTAAVRLGGRRTRLLRLCSTLEQEYMQIAFVMHTTYAFLSQAVAPADNEKQQRQESLRKQQLISEGLSCLGEYEMADILDMGCCWAPDNTILYCDICDGTDFKHDIMVCREVYPAQYLCWRCHEAYEAAGRQIPEKWQHWSDLEEEIKSVRLATSGQSLLEVCHTLDYFASAQSFLDWSSREYARFRKNFAADDESPPTPERSWLMLLSEMNDMKKSQKLEDPTPDTMTKIEELQQKHIMHSRDYRADRERCLMPCKDHFFRRITKEAHEKVKIEGILMDPTSGKLLPIFYWQILNVMSEIAGLEVLRSEAPKKHGKEDAMSSSTDLVLYQKLGSSIRKEELSLTSAAHGLVSVDGSNGGGEHSTSLQQVEAEERYDLAFNAEEPDEEQRLHPTLPIDATLLDAEHGGTAPTLRARRASHTVIQSQRTSHLVDSRSNTTSDDPVEGQEQASTGRGLEDGPKPVRRPTMFDEEEDEVNDAHESADDTRLSMMFTAVQAHLADKRDTHAMKYWPLAVKLADSRSRRSRARFIQTRYHRIFATPAE